MRFLSVCSGIEAASVAWAPLGWKAAAFAEIEPFPSAVLKQHYPEVPNLGDISRFQTWPDLAIDLLVGGTPCQSFSVAGLRGGLADPRGNLALTYLAIADLYRPRWLLWENVPGVLSSNAGRDFGAFLGGLGQLGYGFAYRVLDAQYVRVDGFERAVPQRRRRVFVVGHLGDWRRTAAVLFDAASLYGDSAPRREAGEIPAPTISARTRGGGGLGTDFDCDGGLIAGTLGRRSADHPSGLKSESDFIVPVAFGGNRQSGPLDVATAVNAHGGPHGRLDFESETFVAHSLRASGFDASEDGTGGGTPLVAATLAGTMSKGIARGGKEQGVTNAIVGPSAVRRLTPTECERLQGFSDGYTDVPYRWKPAADGPRYKALGNSMAVNVVRWIGRRIDLVDAIGAPMAEAAE